MTRQLKSAAMTFVIGLMFIGAEYGLRVRTSLAGIFIVGMASGLLLGDRIAKEPVKSA